MILTCDYEMSNGETYPIHININQICTFNKASGKKAAKGYKTVMYTPNGHALYSKIDDVTIVRGIQGKVLTEDGFLELVVAHDQREAEMQAQSTTETH